MVELFQNHYNDSQKHQSSRFHRTSDKEPFSQMTAAIIYAHTLAD